MGCNYIGQTCNDVDFVSDTVAKYLGPYIQPGLILLDWNFVVAKLINVRITASQNRFF